MKINIVQSELIFKSNKRLDCKQIFESYINTSLSKSYDNFHNKIIKINSFNQNIEKKKKIFNISNIGKMIYQKYKK